MGKLRPEKERRYQPQGICTFNSLPKARRNILEPARRAVPAPQLFTAREEGPSEGRKLLSGPSGPHQPRMLSPGVGVQQAARLPQLCALLPSRLNVTETGGGRALYVRPVSRPPHPHRSPSSRGGSPECGPSAPRRRDRGRGPWRGPGAAGLTSKRRGRREP